MTATPPPPPTGPTLPGAWGAPAQERDTEVRQDVDIFAELEKEGGDLKSTDTEPVARRKRITVSARMKQLLDGEIKVEDLDDEELQRGQLRDRNGRFTGARAAMIPRSLHDEMMRRILQRGQEKLRDDYFTAIDTVTQIARDTQVDPNIRLKAADMIITRIAGKPVEKVEMAVTVKPYEKLMEGIIIRDPQEIEGQSWEDTDDGQ